MKTLFVYDNSLVAIRKEAAKQEAINHDIDEDTALSIFTSGAKWYENIISPAAPPHEDKLTEKDFNKSMVKKWIGGYQPTDKLDTSNPPRQTAHEDKGVEELFNEIDNTRAIKWDGLSDGGKWTRSIEAMKIHASNERKRILKIAESISFNTEDQAGNKFVAVDLEELREKLKNK